MKAVRIAFLLLLLLPIASLRAQSLATDSAQARDFFEKKKYAEAAALLEKIWRSADPGASDLILLGLCYTELRQLDKAELVLEAAAHLEPRSVPLLNARASLAFARQRFSEALALFREAQRIDPADKNASAGMVASLTNSGVELAGAGRVEEARKAFQEALVLDPRSVPALRNLGLLELEQGNLLRSAELLERGLEASPREVELLKLLFLLRNRQGDSAAMLPLLDRLIQLQPADPEPYAAKGRLLESRGERAEAAEVFARAVERRTQDPLPYYRMGSERRSPYLLHDAIGKSVQLISALQLQASQQLQKARNTQEFHGAQLLIAKVEEVRATLTSSLALLRELD